MKLLILGSRSITDMDLSIYIPQGVDLIISGGAKGVDALAERYAEKHRINKLIIYPKYEKYGKAAPIKRNKEMIDLADHILAFWDGTSKGTKSSIDYAIKKGKKIDVINNFI
ncbi:MAG: hypothetical protein ACI4DP_05700 [Candidatus Ornithomonoglobus sp.]